MCVYKSETEAVNKGTRPVTRKTSRNVLKKNNVPVKLEYGENF